MPQPAPTREGSPEPPHGTSPWDCRLLVPTVGLVSLACGAVLAALFPAPTPVQHLLLRSALPPSVHAKRSLALPRAPRSGPSPVHARPSRPLAAPTEPQGLFGGPAVASAGQPFAVPERPPPAGGLAGLMGLAAVVMGILHTSRRGAPRTRGGQVAAMLSVAGESHPADTPVKDVARPGIEPPLHFDSRFTLPVLSDDDQTLARANPTSRDDLITFEEVGHTYTYRASGGQTVQASCSCTELVHGVFPQFDADAAITSMMQSRAWPKADYVNPKTGEAYGRDEIKQMWEDNAEDARNRGTWMHFNIERALNGREAADGALRELDHFRDFERHLLQEKGIRTWRTELPIFDEDLDLAGSVDFIGVDEAGVYHICDWKRAREFENKSTETYASGLWPMEHLPDASGTHYALQLNLYCRVLESHYGLRIGSMWLGVFHPDQKESLAAQVPFLDREIDSLTALRRLEVQMARRQGQTPCTDFRHALAGLPSTGEQAVQAFQTAHARMLDSARYFYTAKPAGRLAQVKKQAKQVLRLIKLPQG